MTDRKQRGDDPAVLAQREREMAELELQKADMQQAIARLMGQDDFKMVMGRIIAMGGMFRSVMTGNSMTFYNAGRQDYAREIWAQLAGASLEGAHAMLKPNIGDTDG